MKRLRLILCAGLACALLGGCAALAAPPQRYMARVSHVSDGDTLWVVPESGGAPRKLRLLDIDAPEICQACGAAARAALQALVAQRRVEVRVRAHDSYQRALAQLRVDGQDVGAAMVLAGHAWAGRWHDRAGVYAAQEANARAARRGLFKALAPELPSHFRQRHGSCYESLPR